MKVILVTFGHPCSYIWNKRLGYGRGLNNERGSDKWSQYQTQCGGFSTGVGRPMAGQSLGVRATWEFQRSSSTLLYVTFWIFMGHSASTLEVLFCVLNLSHAYQSYREIFQSTEKIGHLKRAYHIRFVMEQFIDKSSLVIRGRTKNICDTVRPLGRCKCPKRLTDYR